MATMVTTMIRRISAQADDVSTLTCGARLCICPRIRPSVRGRPCVAHPPVRLMAPVHGTCPCVHASARAPVRPCVRTHRWSGVLASLKLVARVGCLGAGFGENGKTNMKMECRGIHMVPILKVW